MADERDYQEVTECRACGGPLPSDNALSLGMAPVVDFPERADAPVMRAPLEIAECPACGLAQLRHTVTADRLYRTFWYRSGTTQSMREALKDVVESAQRRVTLAPGDAVLDIGANDGTLLSLYPREMYRIGYEPALNMAEAAREHADIVVTDYFPANLRACDWEHRFKVITAIAMFYDVPKPGEFLEAVRLALHPEGVFIVQMNYLQTMLKDLAVDNICHEHLGYYSARTFARLAGLHGLMPVGIETNSVNGGSIRVYMQFADEMPDEVRDFLADETAPDWRWFGERLDRVRRVVTGYLERARDQVKRLAVLGASTRGLTLLHFLQLGRETFGMVGDRDPQKHGRFYGATGLPIVSEAEAREGSDVMLCLPWHFEREIREREYAFLQQGGELLFPLPKPKVVRAAETEWL